MLKAFPPTFFVLPDDQPVLAHQPRACAQGLRRVVAVCCGCVTRLCVLGGGAEHIRVPSVCEQGQQH